MSELEARSGLFLDTLIILIPVLIVSFFAERIYKKFSGKDAPENYYYYVVLGAFIIYIILRNAL